MLDLPWRRIPFKCWFWGHKLTRFIPGERCERCGNSQINFGIWMEISLKSIISSAFYNLAYYLTIRDHLTLGLASYNLAETIVNS